ncbi:oxidoreductase [Bernardetia sp.]|uniref:oxidoreductase n=1 Tax=Bernardetia sp. TaxID=1937974 RepID=UPI0025B952D8|nr:oxidoreductase [Bernardetia sp.]
MGKTAVIAGSTGLIGQELIKHLSEDNRYDKILALTRKPKASDLPKVEYVVVDFDHLSIYSNEIQGDDAFCALGTTMKKAGSKEAFYKVDYTYIWEFGKVMAQNGAKSFTLVSSMGADKDSFFYYNEVKGKIEEAISQLDFEKITIARPSLLLGDRNEDRLGEDISKVFVKFFSPIIPAKYDGIESSQVAKAMIVAANDGKNELEIIENDELQKM